MLPAGGSVLEKLVGRMFVCREFRVLAWNRTGIMDAVASREADEVAGTECSCFPLHFYLFESSRLCFPCHFAPLQSEGKCAIARKLR